MAVPGTEYMPITQVARYVGQWRPTLSQFRGEILFYPRVLIKAEEVVANALSHFARDLDILQADLQDERPNAPRDGRLEFDAAERRLDKPGDGVHKAFEVLRSDLRKFIGTIDYVIHLEEIRDTHAWEWTATERAELEKVLRRIEDFSVLNATVLRTLETSLQNYSVFAEALIARDHVSAARKSRGVHSWLSPTQADMLESLEEAKNAVAHIADAISNVDRLMHVHNLIVHPQFPTTGSNFVSELQKMIAEPYKTTFPNGRQTHSAVPVRPLRDFWHIGRANPSAAHIITKGPVWPVKPYYLEFQPR